MKSLTTVGLFVAAIIILLAGLFASCNARQTNSGTIPSPVLTAVPIVPRTSATPPQAAADDTDLTRPEIVKWGGHSSQLAIVVRNQGDREIRSAKALITVYDRNGRQISSSSGQAESTCCTVFGLRPGQEFGLFMNMRNDIAEVGRVVVRYVNMQSVPVEPDHPTFRVQNPVLTLTKNDAVVTATLSARGKVPHYIAGQVFLTDRKHHLVAVISGRFYCYAPGVSRRLRMQLLTTVPHGTQIGKVVAFPIPASEPVGISTSCH